ncbi:TraR/DksA C4-type zinc finger protein [Marinimicrobium sp. ABcell2]|uniref:TraR/DksA family transcriptional regulator n=1 Tax=Marinimicrobium sp. ABcell2 TaxID=3069751 RepID=UPI0027AE4368|nr:TraR/DksA C4-type zinc finger protein [Marinimicrobium sp. ABcell2]MDQ2076220.1 TraR/DksA C4-type zinc finger protein [Marinimicrobium sp. ABcell2]
MSELPPLSESQLLRMPKAEYMNSRQREFFRNRLLTLKKETQEAIEGIKQAIAASEPEADELDRAAAEEENRQRMRLAERQYYLLRKIDQSLNHIEDGSYGYCAVTGEPIGLARLLLRPTAELCVEEKNRQEQQERNYAKQRG